MFENVLRQLLLRYVYRLEQDIGLAKAAGFQSLAVLTGGISLDSLESHCQLDELPDYYLNSVADFSTIMDELTDAQTK